ncbi:WD repeat-containing protein 63-like [Argonauta hians]
MGSSSARQLLPSEARPKKWVSLGSENEISLDPVDRYRPPLIRCVMARRDFGAEYSFGDFTSAADCFGMDEGNFSLLRIELDRAVQAVPVMCHRLTQTRWPNPRVSATQYKPREFTPAELVEALGNPKLPEFIEKVSPLFELALQQNEITDVFFDDWTHLGKDMEISTGHVDGQLKEYQSFCDLEYSKEKAGICMQWHPTIKGVIAISMAQNISLDERFNQEEKIRLKPSLVLLWSFSDPIHPQLMLEAPEDVFCFQFNPSNPNIVAGGCLNGQLVLWDITNHVSRLKQSKGQKKAAVYLPGFEDPSYFMTPMLRNCASSSIEASHNNCITDLQWLPDHFELSRFGVPVENTADGCVQLMTCGGDLQVYVWDIRNPKTQTLDSDKTEDGGKLGNTFQYLDLVWKPLLRINVTKAFSSKDSAISKFSFAERYGDTLDIRKVEDDDIESEASFRTVCPMPGTAAAAKNLLSVVNTHLYVATEFGELFFLDWVPKRDSDSGRLMTEKPKLAMDVHHGAVYALRRSPFNKLILLMVAGWRASLWKEGVNMGPLFLSHNMPTNVVDGCWSLSRPSVFFIARNDGTIDVWDLLDRTHEPFLSQNVTAFALCSIALYELSPQRQLLAVADSSGTLHVLEVPRCFMVGPQNELNSFNHYIDREAKRLAYINERWQKHEQIKAQLDAPPKKGQAQMMPIQPTLPDEETLARDQMLYLQYLSEEAAVLSKMGVEKQVEGESPTRWAEGGEGGLDKLDSDIL